MLDKIARRVKPTARAVEPIWCWSYRVLDVVVVLLAAVWWCIR
jgi:hypothetical protein